MEYKIQKFTDLIAWQKAHILALSTYQLTQSFPSDERFGLMSQMQRAAVSISSNIAEGFGRGTAKDKIQFYLIAKTSLNELHSQILIAHDLGYAKEIDSILAQIDEASRLITGILRLPPSR